MIGIMEIISAEDEDTSLYEDILPQGIRHICPYLEYNLEHTTDVFCLHSWTQTCIQTRKKQALFWLL
jgi:hypothetical protein